MTCRITRLTMGTNKTKCNTLYSHCLCVNAMIFEHRTGGGAKCLATSKKEVPSVVQTHAPVPCSQNINKTKGRGHTHILMVVVVTDCAIVIVEADGCSTVMYHVFAWWD